MSGPIEEAAKTWLIEPAYQKIFKHTLDVIEDYVCYGLIAVGTIALSVRLLSTLGSGDVNCMVLGVRNGSNPDHELGPYPSGSATPLVAYANFNRACVDESMTQFMQSLPYILLMQALLIILIEKFLTKLPRISGKVERFYLTIVEDSLNGRNSDVAEDVCDEKANKEAISRKRQRNEVCNSLKRSNILFFTYVMKNVMEQLLLWAFIPINIYFAIDSLPNLESSICIIDVGADMGLGLPGGQAHFQCDGKKVSFFIILLYFSVALQGICLFCSTGSMIWCLFFRDITNLLRDIQEVSSAEDFILIAKEGRDFIFLFDLLAHTSGIESTLRVLTHADHTFQQICQPRIRASEAEFVKVKEDRLKVVWQAARIEKWCKSKSTTVSVDSYEVTIFPAETSRHTITKMAKDEYVLANDDYYSASFIDLNGGKTEYIVTIACVIGKSRMKGERIITTLLPYGPERPRTGVIKSFTTTELEIHWESPKGEFTKYVLSVDPCMSSLCLAAPELRKMSSLSNISGLTGLTNLSSNQSEADFNIFPEFNISKDGWDKELSSKDTSASIPGLFPGEAYLVVLKTKTGDNETKKPLIDIGMTQPLPVQSLRAEDMEVDKVVIKWNVPRRTLTLKAFNLSCISKDNKISREFGIKMLNDSLLHSFTVDNLAPATEFNVSVTCLCIYEHLKTVSTKEEIQFITKPLPPQNLVLENQQCNSFTIKWESAVILGQSSKYKIGIQSPRIGYSNYMEIPADRDTFTFSKLPDIQGTGEVYTVQVICSLMVDSGEEVDSDPLVGVYSTKPLAPTNLSVAPGTNEVQWTKSPTPNVSYYKIRLRAAEEGSQAQETILKSSPMDREPCKLILQGIESDVVYKVNVYAVVEHEGQPTVESKELHEKVVLTGGELVLFTDIEDVRSDISSRSRKHSELIIMS